MKNAMYSVIMRYLRHAHIAGCLLFVTLTASGQVDSTKGGTAANDNQLLERYAVQSYRRSNVTVVGNPAGGARNVVRIQVQKQDDKVFGGYRSEIAPLHEYVKVGVRWYAISVYFPENWNRLERPAIFGQLHTSQDNLPISPPVAFSLENSTFYLELTANHRLPNDTDPMTKQNSVRQKIQIGSLEKNRWACFVIKVDWSSTPGSGSMKIWNNGDLIYVAENLYNTYSSRLGNYPKAGLYFPGGSLPIDVMAYVDFIHIGGPRTSPTEMLTRTPCN